jgi:predicted transposase/invertase (TIGR01784 family)
MDWIMVLPEKLGDTFWNDLQTYERERNMTYITSMERIGIKKGIQKGREEERQKIVLSMLSNGVSLEDIAKFTELPISEVERLVNEQVEEIQSQQKI